MGHSKALAHAGDRATGGSGADPWSILAALPDPVLALDAAIRIVYANPAAELFFRAGLSTLTGSPLDRFIPSDSPVFDLVRQVRRNGHSVSESDVAIETPRIGSRCVVVMAAAAGDSAGDIVLSFHERSIARRIDVQLNHLGAARSVSALASILAHEVKNPLSGIRGAAQLLEQHAAQSDRELTRLIRDEADRIVALVDRMEMFADERPINRGAVNVHEVLGHVRQIAQSGFARGVRFIERYDPSLPPVHGNRDLLIQAFLNMVKNAAEAAPPGEGEIVLATRYEQGVRLALPGRDSRIDLPLAVSVSDNGPGVPEELRAHLFDPFVTTKIGGKGLGLALVAKIVGAHGGLIELENRDGRTTFHLRLPVAPPALVGRAP